MGQRYTVWTWWFASLALSALQAPSAIKIQAPDTPHASRQAFQTVLSSKCTDPVLDPTDETRWEKAAEQCGQCYEESMQGLFDTQGSDIILGASDGMRYDPAHLLDYWRHVPDHKKVFVEPAPPLYAQLQKNTKDMGHVLALNAAVRGAGNDPELILYCWDLDMVARAVHGGTVPLPPQVRQPLVYWAYHCSINKEDVLRASNVLETPDYERLDGDSKDRVLASLDRHIKRYKVAALAPKEVVRRAGPSDVRYVQIDVEGLDNEIVKGLPFGEDGFSPEVVLYENHRGDLVKPLLEKQGYYVCCCYNSSGNNMVAVRAHARANHTT